MDILTLAWWHWLVLGLVLVLLEMAASGGFYVIFFGVAALVIGSLRVLGLAEPAWQQLLLFSVLSVGTLVLFRNPLIRWLKLDQGRADVDTLAGEIALPLEDIAPGSVGRVECRGTIWQARNAGGRVLPRGARCVIESVSGLMLFIREERPS
ncbi:MAG TPA: NfeD family protein [Vicinamibacterales bacterium]|nr:NfeD family protein [Vicinamibacterales bacterium]